MNIDTRIGTVTMPLEEYERLATLILDQNKVITSIYDALKNEEPVMIGLEKPHSHNTRKLIHGEYWTLYEFVAGTDAVLAKLDKSITHLNGLSQKINDHLQDQKNGEERKKKSWF